MRFAWLALYLSLIAGCGSSSASSRGSPTTTAHDTAAFIALEAGAPEEVLWDEAHQRLFIVDNVGNRIWTWTDEHGLAHEPYATCALPEGESELASNVTLGQAALLDDGTLLVTRFGVPGADAAHGGVVVVHPDGASELVPNLDQGVHRLGIAVAADGPIYVAGFDAAGGAPDGSISKVDLGSGETKVADGFGKLVGLAIIDDHLYVSDQSAQAIFDAALDDLPVHATDWHTFATLAKPDQICKGPDGSLFTGQFQAAPDSSAAIAVRWVAADGGVTTLRADPDVAKPSGVSFDAGHHRLFVADSGDVARLGVHVFPVQ